MQIRVATLADAEAISAIYAPIVANTSISFESEPPTADEMRSRIASTLAQLPWLVSVDERGVGYKVGQWRDVGWWQRALRPPGSPRDPEPFGAMSP